MDETWNLSVQTYRSMVKRHKPFWNFVGRFVDIFAVKSLADIGGGICFARDYAEKYLLVDLDKKLVEKARDEGVEAMYGNFAKLDVSSYKKKYDLVLLAAVVEHCEDYLPMIKKALEMEPKYIIVNFFLRLRRGSDKVVKRKTTWGMKYKLKKYSRKRLMEELESMSLLENTIIFRTSREGHKRQTIADDVLIIKQTNKNIPEFKQKVEEIKYDKKN